jgi:predicted acetylornithine/succinylornithine family transaminase
MTLGTPPTQDELLARARRTLIQSYRQGPIVMERGRGVELWDATGRRYLDLTAGIAVCCLGHAHPRLAAAIARQAERLVHVSNLYFIAEQLRLADEIIRLSFADRVFFCNSGAEANEAALKLARRYSRVVRSEERDLFVATHGSFHGRSFATLAVTGQPKYHADFGPLLGPVELVPFDDLPAAARVLETERACAFIVEPIQAEGGIIVPSPGYLAGLRELTSRTGTLLIFDEVQTGVGRTGRWFGHLHDGVTPDVMSLAKGLAGGVPIGAVLATEAAAAGLAAREGGAVPHASTFGGNPLACAAAATVLEVIAEDDLLARCTKMGELLAGRLAELVGRYPELCVEVRGRGLLRGLTVRRGAADLVGACRDRGLLLSVAGADTVRFAPALIVGAEHIDEAMAIFDPVLAEAARAHAQA